MNSAAIIGKQIRKILVESLIEILGQYQFSSGITEPAIAVNQGSGKYPPPGTQVSGLEIVILPCVSISVAKKLGFSEVWEYQSDISLKQWNSQSSTVEAIDIAVPLLNLLGQVRVSPRVLPLTSLDNIETCRISLIQTVLRRN